MIRRPLATVVGIVVLGLIASSGLAWLRSRARVDGAPSSRLPAMELRLSLEGQGLPARIERLARFPVYGPLLRQSGWPSLRRRLGWAVGIDDPRGLLPSAGPCALGLYPGGWILVRSSDDPPSSSRPVLADGRWRITASDDSLIPAVPVSGSTVPRLPPDDSLRVRITPALLVPPARKGTLARDLLALLPNQANAVLQDREGKLTERWTLSCERACLLDFLDPTPRSNVEASGWSVVPDEATAVEWFRLDPRRLMATAPGASDPTEGTALQRLARLERFLGLPVAEELASSLGGPGVAFVVDAPDAGWPRAVLALDLTAPDRVRKVLDRLSALAVLSGSASVNLYRGVSITSWSRPTRLNGREPAVAVDGSLLLLALSRRDVEDAVDRRRSAPPPNPAGRWRRSLDRMPPGSWKAVSGSGSLFRAWDEIAGSTKASAAGVPAPVASTLRRTSEGWILEGSGGAPAFSAELLLPTAISVLRSPSRGQPSR